MKLDLFFAQFPIFNRYEFVNFLITTGTTNPHTQRELLAYHLKQKRIIRIRRGLYAVIPPQVEDTKNFLIDPYLIAGRITEDAVLAYHTALDFHGISYSVFYQFWFLSKNQIRAFNFQSEFFYRVLYPKKPLEKKQTQWGVIAGERLGLDIRVTNLERTLVDVLDHPEYAGGVEEIWRSLEGISAINIKQIIQYALLLKNATTIAKLGFFLETHQEMFAVSEKDLKKLSQYKPKTYHYFDRSKRQSGKLIKRWNLIVPENIINRSWEEPHVDF